MFMTMCRLLHARLIVASLLLVAFDAAGFAAEKSLPRVRLSADGKSFRTGDSTPFVPWGANYGNQGRLIEDFWETDWPTVEEDFQELRDLGMNVVRVHLQVGKIFRDRGLPHEATLRRLRMLLDLADREGLYLDLTGLACYRPSETPAWYDSLGDVDRWQVQADFWRLVARECRGRGCVFCYDLINEPLSPAEPRTQWRSGSLFGGYDFLQYIAKDPAGRDRGRIALDWIDHLSRAIREEDPDTLITVGLLPWVTGWGHLSGFIPKDVAAHVDFLSVHIYPKTQVPAESVKALEECQSAKPVVIEETFPLECTPEEFATFLRRSRALAQGWMIHYDGTPLSELDTRAEQQTITLAESIWRAGLRTFGQLREELTGAK